MQRTAIAIAALLLCATPAWPAAPEVPAGAASCSGCHATGAKVDTAVPRLIGRSASDIATQMQAFKGGQKPATVMDRIAKGFTDGEIQAIAEWYAQQK